MEDREKIKKAISRLEAERDELGDVAVDAALAGLNQKLSELGQFNGGPQTTERDGERRVVTVLFSDVTGSTALAESMDPEAWTGIMKTAFEYLIEPVERYDGTVARLMGDAILAFFGAPTAHEDDPQRAVLAGLAIVESIMPYREQLRKEQGIDFNVRVGINTGLAVVGDVGSESAGEYTAMGDAVNLAARMEQTASPGTVQVAQDTYALVAPLFDFKELGGIQVKGKSEPVLAYQVLSRKTKPGSLRGLTDQGISSPLVGRENELKSAWRAYDQLSAGQGGILAILGEAGIGKSRLMSELRSAAVGASHNPEQSVRWLEGQTLSFGQTISYWPFQQIFREYAGINDGDSESAAVRKLEGIIKQLFAEETAEILPYLASLLSIEVIGDYAQRVKYLDGEALGRQVYRASRRFIRRLAEQQPLVLLFDDLHWMDASSAGLLEHLMPLVKQVPLLLCGLSRPDPDSPAARLLELSEKQYGSFLTVIELASLSISASHSLVQNLLEVDGFPDHTRQMMLDKADGNPFYLEEIVRNLIENRAVVKDATSGRWLATQRIEKVTVPDTIQGLLMARIDRLDERLRKIIRRAAVIGRAFLYRVLEAILDDDRDLDEKLDQLQSTELILEKQRLPELEFIFKHAMAQEAAYNSILLEERREVHGRVGTAIEILMAGRLDEFYGLLAYHFSAAEQWEQAQEYLFKAGDQAGSIAADAEALAHYHNALEAYTRVRGDNWDAFERAQLERKMGEAFYRLGDFNQARTYLERSLALMGEGLPTTQWGTRLAIGRALLTQIGHQLFPTRFVKPISNPVDSRVEEIYLAVLALTWIEAVSDFERWLLVSISALNATERYGYPYASAYLASVLSSAFDSVGQHGLAERYYHLAEGYSEQVVPYRPVFQLAWNRSFHYNLHGDFDRSLKYAHNGLEIAHNTGDLRSWGTAMDLAAWAQHIRSKFSKAVETRLEMISVAEEGSDPQVLCWGYFGLGATQIRLGQIDEAIGSLKRAIEVAEEVPDFHTQLGAGAWLGRCYLAKGELTQALLVVEDSQELFSLHGVVVDAPYLGNSTSEIYLMAAESTNGEARQRWLKKAKRSCRDTVKVARNNRPTLPDALLLQGRYEWLQGKPEAAQKWWEKATKEAQRICDTYLEGTIQLEIGRRLGNRDHLQHAESILEEIGAEHDLAIARETLADLWD